ncbi:MAG TPA: hypothetical protein VKP13_09560 [Nitrospira sp.]|nr:hypothetical protein [Nitrospira sp.]
MQAVPAQGGAIATVTSSIQSMHFCNIGTVNYMINFTNAGGAQAVNLGNSSVVTITAAGTFSTPTMDQWKSERAVIVDPTKGYFSWDGNLFYSPGSLATVSVVAGGTGYTAVPTVSFSGGGGTSATATASILGGAVSAVTLTALGSGFTSAPTVAFTGGGGTATTATCFIMPTGQTGSAVAVYSGRVWIGNSRTLTYTAPGTWVDFNAADAAGNTTITEGFLRNQIEALEALNNYLYVFGDSSIFIISDLKVTGAITTFSFTNLSSTIGSTFPASVTAMERAIMFMNKNGVYAAFGASVQKISNELDGIFKLIDFSQPVSGGLASIYNILCYVVSFVYQDATLGNRQLQAVFFSNKWFLTSQESNMVYCAPAEIDGISELYAVHDTHFHKMYADTTAAISTTLQTALMDEGNPIFDKQTNRVGLEYTTTSGGTATFNVQVDTENAFQLTTNTATSVVEWINASRAVVTWQNNSLVTVDWSGVGYQLYDTYSDVVGKYLGYTISSTSPGIIINGLLGEYERRAAW